MSKRAMSASPFPRVRRIADLTRMHAQPPGRERRISAENLKGVLRDEMNPFSTRNQRPAALPRIKHAIAAAIATFPAASGSANRNRWRRVNHAASAHPDWIHRDAIQLHLA